MFNQELFKKAVLPFFFLIGTSTPALANNFDQRINEAISAVQDINLEDIEIKETKIKSEIALLKLIRMDLKAVQFVRDSDSLAYKAGFGLVNLTTTTATAITSIYLGGKAMSKFSGAPDTIVYKETPGYTKYDNHDFHQKLNEAINKKAKDMKTTSDIISENKELMKEIEAKIAKKTPKYYWVRDRRIVDLIPGGKSVNEMAEFMSRSKGWVSGTIRGSAMGIVAPFIAGKNTIVGLFRAFPNLVAFTMTASVAGTAGSNLYLLFQNEEQFENLVMDIDQTIEDLEALL